MVASIHVQILLRLRPYHEGNWLMCVVSHYHQQVDHQQFSHCTSAFCDHVMLGGIRPRKHD